MVDFKAWTKVSDDEREAIVQEELRQAKAATAPVKKQSQAELQAQWAVFGSQVVARIDADTYQRLITYCMLAGATPAIVAKIVKDYITLGKLPWKG